MRPYSALTKLSSVPALAMSVTALGLCTPAFAQSVDHVPGDFATIQEAVDRGAGAVIEVAAGDWAGAVVSREVVLKGLPGARIVAGPKLDGMRAGFVMPEAGTGSYISGFAFRCDATSLDMGVYGSRKRVGSIADAVSIENNEFVGCVQGVTNAGLPQRDCEVADVDGGRFWVVADNTFRGFTTRSDSGRSAGGIGVVLFNAEGADVIGNHFTGRVADTADFTTSGVSLGGCWDCTVANNDFSVRGGVHYWAAVSNLGFYQKGAAASQGVILSDNDARMDSAPTEVNFRSIDSFRTEVTRNGGVTLIDHTVCGDRALDLIER